MLIHLYSASVTYLEVCEAAPYQSGSLLCSPSLSDITSLLSLTPSPHFVLVGEQLHLYCTFDGIPAPVVMWLKDGSAFNITDPDISVVTNATYSQITVGNVTESDSGTYSCNITNSVGNAQGLINVTAVDGV